MTHELKKIFETYVKGMKNAQKAVLATVVALEGSSYRKPGVRMLIFEKGQMIGAVSGGCVEKEIYRQAIPVFKDDRPRIMTYDGRFRLGCEGILYILIEPFRPNEDFLKGFFTALQERSEFSVSTYYQRVEGPNSAYGTIFQFQDVRVPLHPTNRIDTDLEVFTAQLKPCFKLVIIGAEHDAVQLCLLAGLLGWEVSIVAHPSEEKKLSDFPGAREILAPLPEDLDVTTFDRQTAIILMTHSYVKDLQYLIALQKSQHVYLGLLGPQKRREKLLNEFLEYCPEITDSFFGNMYGPAGLNIGAETPQEIALSILSEILAVIHDKSPIFLRDKAGGIHS
jgi:xanthine/CO dehydrogenase XdhC/CoxF family maturation factor